jgi:hypothetical protein
MPQILRCGFPVMYLIESGEKRYAMIPATVKYLEDEDWAATNLAAHDAYRFDWFKYTTVLVYLNPH